MAAKSKAKSAKKTESNDESLYEIEITKSVGVRELRQHASKVLDLVKNGEVIVVTERGIPVAQIAPVKKDKVQILMEQGAITPAKAPFDPVLWNRTDGPRYPDALADFLKERHEAKY